MVVVKTSTHDKANDEQHGASVTALSEQNIPDRIRGFVGAAASLGTAGGTMIGEHVLGPFEMTPHLSNIVIL